MRSILFILSACVSANLWAQTGNYFLSHYSPSEERFDYVCFDIAQDPKGVMYFATKAGILEFDGRDWELLNGSSAIYSMKLNATGEIYWSGAKGFGKVIVDKHGFQQIVLLSDSTVVNVFQSMIVKDQVYFLAEEAVYRYDPAQNRTTVIAPLAKEHTLLKIFELFGVPYVNTDYGTFRIDHDKLATSKLNLNQELIFASRIDNNYVLATADNKLYTLAEDLVLKPVHQLQDQAYIDASVIVNGSWLNRQLLALGTLRGGVVFVNPINGITEEIINYSTGLPDNEVFQMLTDANQNVWVSHDYGFTKISPYMPLRSFSHYEGLKGNLLCALSSQNTVYVGTSLGLFKLETVDIYDELVYYVDVEVKQPKKTPGKKQAQTPPASVPQQEQPTQAESKKSGLFGFLKRNKNARSEAAKEEQSKTTPAPAAREAEEESDDKPRYRRVKKTEKVLRSSQHVFRQVQGVDAKINHLVEVNGKLIAGGLGGLFEINNLQAKQLVEEPMRYVYSPANTNIVIISTYENEVRTLRLMGNYVENSSLFTSLDDQIHYAFEGPNEVWFCGIDKLYRAEMKGGDIRHKQTIELPQSNTDKTVGIVYNNEVLLANADGFYHYLRAKNTFEKIDSLPKPSQYFAHNNSIVFHDPHGWNFLGAQKENNLQLLNVFQDLRFISSDKKSQNLWLISGGNELYKFFGEKVTPFENEFPIFLKSIFNQDKKVVKLNEIIIDQEHSAVKFEVVQPDYINPQAVEFRYFLKGMQEDWSEWSSENDDIQFPYLPTGDYELLVQARNIFGKVSELEPLSFEVLPPYWKRSWFYALEFSVFAMLVLLSFRLSTRYRIVSRLLSLLTIILLIEFIQTAIEATVSTQSPVSDFFIQVVVALLVLPVEGYLRNLMLRSLDSSGKFYQFLVPKAIPRAEKPEKFIKETSEVDD